MIYSGLSLNIPTMYEQIEYAIYVRKSTEDNSWERQAQSIPDQIRTCVKYAKEHDLLLKEKPADFEFEDEKEIQIEDNDREIEHRKIYQETRKYYIIKERMSAKEPGRPKWNKLIKKIQKWEIKWLLSYSPDRQARNMVDGWNLIDCVDKWYVDLKYTNFNFEPNAAGKMMLWMWFVFSKQYSDKLWEDVNRWKKSWVMKWKSQWAFKYWYRVDDNWFYVPDGKNFDLMKEAFRKKVEDKASDVVIANWLNDNDFYKTKWKKREKVTSSALYAVWIDSFYYWMFVDWKNSQDLREVEWLNFIPMIPEEWHNELVDRFFAKKKVTEIKNTKWRTDEYAYSLPEWMLKTMDWYALVPYITKKKFRLEKYEELKKENPSLTLEEFMESKFIRYEIKTLNAKKLKSSKRSNNSPLAINQDEVERFIERMLYKITITKAQYDHYLLYFNKKLDNIVRVSENKKSSINMRLWSLTKERREYIKKYMGYNFRDWEKELYDDTIKQFDEKEYRLRLELNDIQISERSQMEEFSNFLQILQKAGELYRKSSKVRKKKICKLLVSNIFIDNKKELHIERNSVAKNILDVKSSGSGLARLELATRGFGDHRSTSELQPYIIQSISLILCLKHDISSKEWIFDLAPLQRRKLALGSGLPLEKQSV